MKRLRKPVFWPPFIILLVALTFSVVDSESFLATLNQANQGILSFLGPVFSVGSLVILFICLFILFSPLGKVRIGGEDAKPILTPSKWFAIALCTNTAVGILFWATAEPIFHYTKPPVSMGITPGTHEAAVFAMGSLYHHWSFIPCAMYAMPALMFALVFYNLKQPFSLASCLVPLFGEKRSAKCAVPLDALLLLALVSGMSASLATGILTIAGGLEHLYNFPQSPIVLIGIGALIVGTFIVSAASGLQKGIRILSDLNMKLFFVLIFIFLIFGPFKSILGLGLSGLINYAQTFVSRSLFIGFSADDPWPRDWTIFYWAVWLAWAPVTALFLGRIGYGYRVKEFLYVNMLGPAVFAIVWMTVFGGTTLSLEMEHGMGLGKVLATGGPEQLAYVILGTFPAAAILIPFFLTVVFIAYVTAADSNTTAIAGMCAHGVTAKEADPPLSIKIIWGVILGAVALVMLCLSGVDGIKTLSYLGGGPSLFFELFVAAGFVKILISKEYRNWG